MSTLEITYNIVAPIFIVIGITALFNRWFEIDANGLSRLVIYLFAPCLVLERLAKTELGAAEAGQLVAMAVLSTIVMVLIAWGLSRFLRLDRNLESTVILCAALTNNGNYGLPLNRFAFGVAGEERALIFFATAVVIANTFGVFLASRGKGSTRSALLNVLKVPLPYAALAGLLLNVGRIKMPVPLDRSITLLGEAAIPGMLVILGLHLSSAMVRRQNGLVLMVSGLRLIVGPISTILLAMLLGLSGTTRQVAIVQASMPTAVITSILATEFGGDAEFATAEIVISTLASMVTLSVLLALIM